MSLLPAPLLTCWPVLSEAAWLSRSRPSEVDQLLKSPERRFVGLLTLNEKDAAAIAAILQQYRDLKPLRADAALVHLAERESISTIFTLDQRGFRVYRLRRNRPFQLVPELH